MSWKRRAKTGALGGLGCASDLLMWLCVAPALGVLIALSAAWGDLLSLIGLVAFSVFVFVLHVLATWD